MKHGGKRQGAGRRSLYNEKTKPIRLPISLIDDVQQFIEKKAYLLPLYDCKVAAGFPSPADDNVSEQLNLNDYLVKHPAATFLVKVSGNSMINAGIYENDILIVDRSIPPSNGKIVIAAIDGQLTVKRLQKQKNGEFILMPENPEFEPIIVSKESESVIWGVVTNVIHHV